MSCKFIVFRLITFHFCTLQSVGGKNRPSKWKPKKNLRSDWLHCSIKLHKKPVPNVLLQVNIDRYPSLYLINKEIFRLFQANTISITMRVCISASFAIRICLAQKRNSMRVVDGQHSMTSWTRGKLRYTGMQVLQVNLCNKCILCERVLIFIYLIQIDDSLRFYLEFHIISK